MNRLIAHAKKSGYQTVVLDIQLADDEHLSNLTKFTKWLCETSSEELEIPPLLDTYWKGSSNNYRTTRYFQKYLLKEIDKHLVIALDNVDLIFENSNIAKDFCGLLRSWNQKAESGDKAFSKLNLIVVHSTEVYSTIDIDQSPLANVGLTVELKEFSFDQVCKLVEQYQLPWENTDIERLMNLVGGHPFLVKQALERVAKQQLTFEKLLQIAHTESALYGDHLRRHLLYIEENSELLSAMKQVIATNNPVQLSATHRFQLHRMGLVNLEGNKVKIRCKLYKKYLCDCLGVSE